MQQQIKKERILRKSGLFLMMRPWLSQTKIQIHDLKNSTFSTKNFPYKFPQYFGNINLRNSLILVGGITSYRSYEIETDQQFKVKFLADMIIKKRLFTLCSLAQETKLYAVGGWGQHLYLPNCEAYSRKTNKWKEIVNLPQGKRNIATCGVTGEWIYAFNGATTGPVTDVIYALNQKKRENGWIVAQINSSIPWKIASCLSALCINVNEIIVFGSNFNPRVFHLLVTKEGELEKKQAILECINHVAIHSDTSCKRVLGGVFSTQTNEHETLHKLNQETLKFTKIR